MKKKDGHRFSAQNTESVCAREGVCVPFLREMQCFSEGKFLDGESTDTGDLHV